VKMLNPSAAPPVLHEVGGFDMRVSAEPWWFAERHAEEIAAHWRAAAAKNPALFNGRVLIARELLVEDGIVRATYVEIDYSVLLYWRSLGFPSLGGAANCFGAGVVVTADGAVLLAEMGRHTANAGRIFFPAGTPDRSDLRGDRLDIESSILRELGEETGLTRSVVRPSEQRWAILDGPLAACARRLDTDLDADELEERIRGFLAEEEQPELGGVVLARSMADVDPVRVPAYAQALLRRLLPG
jgi:8-oxo-dGTP pyrophosphatase MutT (NUDIX family)